MNVKVAQLNSPARWVVSTSRELLPLDGAPLRRLDGVGVRVVLGHVQRLVDHLRDRLDLGAQLLLDLVKRKPAR